MAHEDSRVFITSREDSLVSQDGEPAVYFCIRLSPALLHRANVLEALSETHGMATLPSGISNEDFLLWEKSSPSTTTLSTTQLARVLQVSDALADTCLPQWAHVLAQRVAATNWDVPESCEDIHCALLSLQHPIRHAVMQALLSMQPAAEALLALPPTLHASLTAALISPSGTLCQGRYRGTALQILLTHLPSLSASGLPTLRSLDLSGSSLSPSSCHLLGQTLSTHTRLSALSLHLTDSASASLGCMEALASVLPHSHSLRDLSLTHSALTEPVLRHLTLALQCLPDLLSLNISTVTPPTSVEPPADAPAGHWLPPAKAAEPLRDLMHGVAAHPALSHLSIATRDVPFSAALFPATCPRLRTLCLTLVFCDAPAPTALADGTAAAAAPQFPALTRLDFRLHAGSASARWTAAAVQRLLPLHADGADCPDMRTLNLFVQPEGADEYEQAIWNALAGSIWPCPALEQLTLGCCDATAAIHAVTSQLRRRTRLTSLLLNGLFAELDPPAWASFFGALAALPALRRVRLRPYHAASQGLTTRLTEALRTFRGLTELSLQGGSSQDGGEMPVLRCDIFAQGLRAVTALRMLGLHDVGLVVPGELWRALRGLSLLQELRVSFCQVDEAEAAPLAAVLPHLPALSALDLEGNQLLGPGALTVARALCALPRLRVAELGMNEIDEEYDGDIAAIQADLAARSVTLSLDALPSREL